MTRKSLKIIGARENNLKDISTEIPHDCLVAVTGLSGSGKSSLAYRTVYAEGQRRYIETFSPYTRQFFDKVRKPDADSIESVRPAIAIQQKTKIQSSRSTVGSLTDVNDYLKVLWSNFSSPICPNCKTAIQKWSAQDVRSYVLTHAKDSVLVIASISLPKKKRYRATRLEQLMGIGISRFFDPECAEVQRLEDTDSPALTDDGSLLAVLDRVRCNSSSEKRLLSSIEQAYALSAGRCLIVDSSISPSAFLKEFRQALHAPCGARGLGSPLRVVEFRDRYYCNAQELQFETPRPSLFSFNHPLGACEDCKGFGKVLRIDPQRCVPDETLSINDGAVHCWDIRKSTRERKRLIAFCESEGIPLDVPWKDISASDKEKIFTHDSRDYRGVYPWFKRMERKLYKMHIRVFFSRYRSQFTCPGCQGTRLKPAALVYQIDTKTISDIWALPIADALEWIETLEARHANQHAYPKAIEEVFRSLRTRLQYLVDLGLPYITLDRQARTLSGGETQRVNLATALGSDLVSTHFVLDEPSVGLHPRDTDRLISSMRKLSDRGNSVLIVEHDTECLSEADHIIELGPEAGSHGGEIVYGGPQRGWGGISTPLTQLKRSKKQNKKTLKIKNATRRNLRIPQLEVPIGQFVCLTGVSGSGKSTLVSEVILRAFEESQSGRSTASKENLVSGLEVFEQVLMVDQTGLAKNPRANIATYTKLWDRVRTMLATTEDARLRALDKSAFSFNVEGGRCPACNGAGYIREDMQFLSDVYIACERCLGKRFQDLVLEVQWKNKNVDQLLNLTVDDARSVFEEFPKELDALHALCQLGLGHLRLGHPLSELSGGEAQRLKLVPFLQKATRGQSLLIFDEPTTGLHVRDVEKLIALFGLLRDEGHTVLCIEHNLQLMYAADWLIDLGPEGGEGGGMVLLEGTPASFLKSKERSYTAQYLQDFVSTIEKGSTKKRTARKRSNSEDSSQLIISGAREHNLKNVSTRIPTNTLVAVTGVSGSGKSTLAKDIIYAEGQRRYLDCLSPYARQFIKELSRPDIDAIRNIMPTICVYQHTFQPSRLSTLGTMSEVYNFLRLLFSKIGIQHCPDHPDQEIAPLSALEIAEDIAEMTASSVRILAPVIKSKKGLHRAVFQRAIQSDISEVRVDGEFGSPGSYAEGLERAKPHTIEFTIAKFNPANLDIELIEETVAHALGVGGGTLILHSGTQERVMSLERACPVCKKGFFRPDPEDFSFNSSRGVCSSCKGRGVTKRNSPCTACGGTRLSAIGRSVRINGKTIHDLCLLSAPQLLELLEGLHLGEQGALIAAPILRELTERVASLSALGLDYLPLDRDCTTLSSGELQRLRLAAAMGSPLTSVMFIFDEPSAGLHPLDNKKVLSRLRELCDAGNSVLVIEHDSDSILNADHILDIGPGGGREGGEVVFNGTRDEFLKRSDSQTAQALRGEMQLTSEIPQRSAATEFLQITGARKNNLKNLEIKVPLQRLVSVAGVSGAGKSSLVHQTIYEPVLDASFPVSSWMSEEAQLKASLPIDRVLLVDQKPIGTNSRSTPISYLKIWDEIRKLFARTLDARSRGWTASHFSYNTGKGRCPDCKGAGEVKLEMSFLADARVVCERCRGTRFTEETKEIRYLDHSIDQVLNLTFDEARTLFANHRKIHRMLQFACDLGLGYLTLGQSSPSLSGGESQRIKLVAELSRTRKGHTLYILDEPTTGLHKVDVQRLLAVLHALVDQGSSVLLIEHDRDVLAASDYLVELGPGPGSEGGKVVYQGSPDSICSADSPWGRLWSSTRPESRACAAI